MKAKKAVYLSEEESKQLHLPTFFMVYSLFVLFLLIATFLVLLIAVITIKTKNQATSPESFSDLMLKAVLIIQIAGLGYFLPFYFFPEILCIMKYERHRRLNISFLVADCAAFSMFYPLFRILMQVLA